MRRRAVAYTLIELLVVLTLTVILTVAVATAFRSGIEIQNVQARRQGATNERQLVEITLLGRAILNLHQQLRLFRRRGNVLVPKASRPGERVVVARRMIRPGAKVVRKLM